MATYYLVCVEGSSVVSANGAVNFFGPTRSILALDAPSRADAFIRAYRQLATAGRDVTAMETGRGLPLDFTPEEAERISARGAVLTGGYPKQGVQIEQLVRLEGGRDTERPSVRFAELPGVTLSSAEDEVLGRWVIFYTWDKPNGDSLIIPISESDVAGLVGQAQERAFRAGSPFDIEQERRNAADSLLPREFRRFAKVG